MSEPGAVATGFRVHNGEKNPVITIPGSDKTNYNVLFKDESGVEADSLERRSKTCGTLAGAAKTYHEILLEGDKVSEILQTFYGFIGTNQMMAYLVMT